MGAYICVGGDSGRLWALWGGFQKSTKKSPQSSELSELRKSNQESDRAKRADCGVIPGNSAKIAARALGLVRGGRAPEVPQREQPKSISQCLCCTMHHVRKLAVIYCNKMGARGHRAWRGQRPSELRAAAFVVAAAAATCCRCCRSEPLLGGTCCRRLLPPLAATACLVSHHPPKGRGRVPEKQQ